MITLDENELIGSLQDGYKKLEAAKSEDNKNEIHKIYGWCLALEGILFTYAPEVKERVIAIRNSIVTKKNVNLSEQDWDVPTYIRQNLK